MQPAQAARTPPAPTPANLDAAALSASPADAGTPAPRPDTPFPPDTARRTGRTHSPALAPH
eukprot:scaffold319281_cov24-Tisochrysis_lutea.AAC.1